MLPTPRKTCDILGERTETQRAKKCERKIFAERSQRSGEGRKGKKFVGEEEVKVQREKTPAGGGKECCERSNVGTLAADGGNSFKKGKGGRAG